LPCCPSILDVADYWLHSPRCHRAYEIFWGPPIVRVSIRRNSSDARRCCRPALGGAFFGPPLIEPHSIAGRAT
jgi:hypothetical protein